jgi:hypothetical protein
MILRVEPATNSRQLQVDETEKVSSTICCQDRRVLTCGSRCAHENSDWLGQGLLVVLGLRRLRVRFLCRGSLSVQPQQTTQHLFPCGRADSVPEPWLKTQYPDPSSREAAIIRLDLGVIPRTKPSL